MVQQVWLVVECEGQVNNIRTSGWFWERGKELSSTDVWTIPLTRFSKYDGFTGDGYPNEIYSYTYNGTIYTYGTINMNLLADKDYIGYHKLVSEWRWEW